MAGKSSPVKEKILEVLRKKGAMTKDELAETVAKTILLGKPTIGKQNDIVFLAKGRKAVILVNIREIEVANLLKQNSLLLQKFLEKCKIIEKPTVYLVIPERIKEGEIIYEEVINSEIIDKHYDRVLEEEKIENGVLFRKYRVTNSYTIKRTVKQYIWRNNRIEAREAFRIEKDEGFYYSFEKEIVNIKEFLEAFSNAEIDIDRYLLENFVKNLDNISEAELVEALRKRYEKVMTLEWLKKQLRMKEEKIKASEGLEKLKKFVKEMYKFIIAEKYEFKERLVFGGIAWLPDEDGDYDYEISPGWLGKIAVILPSRYYYLELLGFDKTDEEAFEEDPEMFSKYAKFRDLAKKIANEVLAKKIEEYKKELEKEAEKLLF